MRILRAATVAMEVAHRGLDGRIHGHSLTAEVWTGSAIDLDVWRQQIADVAMAIEGQLEQTIGARTFEDVAVALLTRLPAATRVVLRLPTRGHLVQVERGDLSVPAQDRSGTSHGTIELDHG